MSLLNHKCLPTLSGKYEAIVKDYREVTNSQGGYIELVLTLPDREFKYCVFPSQLDYVASCLNRQLEAERDTFSLGEALDQFKTNGIKLDVWFSYNETYGRMNVALHEETIAEEIIDGSIL
jgi:hypothetical protein